ncbi:MAG: hypothetical protein FWD49_04905 [Firmicutes bacterium]|nr:hypothetical protein [Bacillota bacterium]
MTKEDLLKEFLPLFNTHREGVESFITNQTDDFVINRILDIEKNHLALVQLNQMLVFSKAGAVSQGFFEYYWCEVPPEHNYRIKTLGYYPKQFDSAQKFDNISTTSQLFFGFYRIFVDCLYNFGNITVGYNKLRKLNKQELVEFFKRKRIDFVNIMQRGAALKFDHIDPEKKYLISENVCKNFGDNIDIESGLEKHLIESYKKAKSRGIKRIRIKNLLNEEYAPDQDRQLQFEITAEDIKDKEVQNEEEIRALIKPIALDYIEARKAARKNTNLYLSLVNDLDVYVATSMRNKKDFLAVSGFIERLFHAEELKTLDLRYFDPTMSAADGHEDKGIIECLMVKSAKVLIYSAGEKESYGKDAEAAMALSLGKPVIFYCEKADKNNLFKNIHPLTRLICFETGVVCGAIICNTEKEVQEIIRRIFYNDMLFELKQDENKQGYYKLYEKKTQSVIRIQTDDKLLESSFWNFYNSK